MANHLSALLKKNWILWRRNLCCSICEILLPTLLVFALIGVRTQISKTQVNEISYVNLSSANNGPYIHYSKLIASNLSSSNQQPPSNGIGMNLSNPQTGNQQGNESQGMDESFYNSYSILKQYKLMKSYNIQRKCMGNGGGKVGLIQSSNDEITQLITTLNQSLISLNYDTISFQSETAMFSIMTDSQYGKTSDKPYICFGIGFNQYIKGKYQYSLYFNESGSKQDKPDIPTSSTAQTQPVQYENLISETYWISSGFLSIQNYIDNLILKHAASDESYQIQAAITSVRVPAHTNDDFPTTLSGSIGIYLVLPLMIVYLRMTYALLYEKQQKLKEGMKMMGLQNSSFYLSWIITYFLIYTMISLIVTILLVSQVFTHTSFGVIFFIHWLFCMVLICQSLFISVFFTRTLMGIIIAIVFFLIQYMVVAIINSSGTIPQSDYWGASVCSHAGLSFAFDVMLSFEASSQGVQFSTINTVIDNYYIGMAIAMDFVNIFFYLLLGLYLDQVFPNEFGKKQHPLFFIKCFFRQSAKIDNNKLIKQESQRLIDNVEEVEPVLKELIHRNQCVDVRGLYKTFSTGKQAVQNLSIQMYENQIFALLGHNGAGKTTTISMLTGMLDITSGSATAYGLDIETEMDSIRKIMGVCPQHDILFDNLTVKEHLEMFATFKGMKSEDIDNEVKKLIEDVDLVEKTDYLSSTLSGGQKRRLSVAIAFIGGSKLIYLDEPTSGMDTSARRYIWTMLKNYKSQRIVILTTHFMDEADFLGDRIGIMGEGKLICCGSSVFLKNKFGVGYNLTMVKENSNVQSTPIIDFVTKIIKEGKLVSNVSSELSFQLPLGSVTLFPKLFDELDENLKQFKIESYGISITTLEEVFLKVAQIGAGHQQVDDFKKNENEDSNMNQIDDFDINSIRIIDKKTLFITHTTALIKKRVRYLKRDIRGLTCEIFLPCLIVSIGLALMTISYISNPSSSFISASNVKSNQNNIYWAGPQTVSNNIFNYFDKSLFSIETQLNSSSIKIADLDYFNKYSIRNDIGWYYLFNTSTKNFSYLIAGNSVQRDAYPILLNEMNQAILRNVSGISDATITVKVSPFPLTKDLQNRANSVTGYLGAFIFSIGMSFIPASVISYIVKEREINMKHQQLVSGVSIYAYWSSNFIMDVGKHIIPAVFCCLMIEAFNITTMIYDNCYGASWLLFFLYGWAIIPFSYAFSFLFKQQGNALLVSFFMHLIFGAIISIIFFVLRLISSTRSGSKIAAWFIRIIPSFSFAFGVVNMANRSTYQSVEGLSSPQDVFSFDISGGDLIMLFISGIFYMVLVFVIELLEDAGHIQKLGSKEESIQYQPKIMDDDVQKENQLSQTLNEKEQAVLVRNMRKIYMLEGGNHKVAVDQVSFSVGNGEVFGLLGVNGAGKTTTFKMLSGEIKPTSGNAWIAGHDIVNHMEEARRNIGYCPQFDALLDNLTVLEHLELFTVIKGIPQNLQENLVNKKLKEMDLERFRHIQSGTLSGGNKRKLSVALAMIGNPPIVFLDEPSTGMDPEARRFMWNVISRIATERKQSSIILTTHSMEEAEALCTKMAIQVDGNFRCIGSVQHIKNKFGKGYELEIKVQLPLDQEILQLRQSLKMEQGVKIYQKDLNQILQTLNVGFMQNEISQKGYGSQLYFNLINQDGILIESLLQFVQVELYGIKIMNFINQELGSNEIIEHFQTFYRFRLNSQISVGKLFGKFEQFKQELKISQYSIKQASIEQIFNNFATQQLSLAPPSQNQNNNLAQIELKIPISAQPVKLEIGTDSMDDNIKKEKIQEIEMQQKEQK